MFDRWVPDEVEPRRRGVRLDLRGRARAVARLMTDAHAALTSGRPLVLPSLRDFRHDHWAHITSGFAAVLVVWAALIVPERASGHRAEDLVRLLRMTGGDLGDRGMAHLARLDASAALIALRVARLPPSAPEFRGPDDTNVSNAAQTPPVLNLPGLTPDQAKLINASIPVSAQPNPAAKPFFIAPDNLLDATRAVDCLTAAVYYESAGQPLEGQQAVAQVILNRMRHPAFPKSVCGVVFQGSNRPTGCQFTFTCDGSLFRKPSERSWARAREVATAALNGFVMKGVGNATHYHADYVAPYWSTSLVKVAQIGAHIFYRWTGGWGLPRSFDGVYSGEPSLELAALTGRTPDLNIALTSGLDGSALKTSGSVAGVQTLAAITPASTVSAEPAEPKIAPVVEALATPAPLAEIAKPAPKKQAPARGEWRRLPAPHSF